VASTLKVSPSTIRRWVRSGRLPSTQVVVAGGFEYRVPLEALEGVKASTEDPPEAFVNSSTSPSMKGSTNPSASTILEASVERSTAVAAYNAQLLAPLVAVIERQADTIRDQAETIGRQAAELDAARGQIQALTPSTEAQSIETTPEPAWHRLHVYVVTVVVLVTLVLVATLVLR